MAYNDGPDFTGLPEEIESVYRAAYPQPIQQPTYKPVARDHRIGRFNINGGALDSATLAVLQAMQNAPRATSGAGGFAQGLVSGFAGARGRQIGQRQNQYERDEQRAADEAEERRRFRSQAGASLAKGRWDMYRESKQPRSTGDPNEWVDVTPEILQWAKENDIAIAPGVRKIKATDLTRNKPIVDPTLAEGRELRNEYYRDRQVARSEEEAVGDAEVEQSSRGIATFVRDPFVPARDKRRNAIINKVNDYLLEPGAPKKSDGKPYSYQELLQYWADQQAFLKSVNSQRFTQLRQSAATLAKHIESFKNFYNSYREEYEKKRASASWLNPKEMLILNKGMLFAAKNGLLGKDATRAATRLSTAAGRVAKESAIVFAGGYAPEEAENREARENIADAIGPEGHAGQMEALEELVRARLQVATSGTPYFGLDNPYLLQANPISGWEEGKKSAETFAPPPKPKDGGKASRWSK